MGVMRARFFKARVFERLLKAWMINMTLYPGYGIIAAISSADSSIAITLCKQQAAPRVSDSPNLRRHLRGTHVAACNDTLPPRDWVEEEGDPRQDSVLAADADL